MTSGNSLVAVYNGLDTHSLAMLKQYVFSFEHLGALCIFVEILRSVF